MQSLAPPKAVSARGRIDHALSRAMIRNPTSILLSISTPLARAPQHAHDLASNPGAVDIDRGDRRPHVAGHAQVAETGDRKLVRNPDPGCMASTIRPWAIQSEPQMTTSGCSGRSARARKAEAALAEVARHVDVETRGFDPPSATQRAAKPLARRCERVELGTTMCGRRYPRERRNLANSTPAAW
jgi:hypothetical protein